MDLVLIAAETVVSTIGSLVAAAVLCWLLWWICRVALHPEWSAVGVLILLALGLFGLLPKSLFLKMTLMFVAIAAIPLWIAGREWRLQDRDSGRGHGIGAHHPVVAPVSASSVDAYPALSACMREDRLPTRDEIHVVAARLWRDGLTRRFGSSAQPASFAARRFLLRAARVVLSGDDERIGTPKERSRRGPTVR